jgi:mRNA interferase RelE/StbE
LTIYSLAFLPTALKEWRKLDKAIRLQFEKKLAERLIEPEVPSSRLSGMPGCYKIKLRGAGYRLVYRVEDAIVTVTVVAVGRRDRNQVYKIAVGRLEDD